MAHTHTHVIRVAHMYTVYGLRRFRIKHQINKCHKRYCIKSHKMWVHTTYIGKYTVCTIAKPGLYTKYIIFTTYIICVRIKSALYNLHSIAHAVCTVQPQRKRMKRFNTNELGEKRKKRNKKTTWMVLMCEPHEN